MKMLCVSLLLLTLVGCAHSNPTWHWPALYYNDSKALADRDLQQYLADLNRQQNSIPFVSGGLHYTYTPLDW